MKKILLLISLTSLLFAYKDFGIQGKTYEIIEPNIKDYIESEVKNYQANMNKEEIHKKIKSELEKQAFYSTKLPVCEKDNSFKEPNYQYLQEDIVNPAGRIYKHKGDAVIVRTPKPFNICFINAKNKIEMQNQIDYYDKTVKTLSGKETECVYMVSDRSVLEMDQEYQPRMFYPTGAQYEKRFNVKCYPSLIHIEEDMKYNYEMSMEHFKHGE